MVSKVHIGKFSRKYIVRPHGMMECVDDGVSRDENTPLGYTLREKIRVRGRCRSKVQGRNAAREAAVHLLGERRVDVVRTKPRLNVSDGDLMVVCGECAGKGGGRVAVDEDEVGTLLLEHLVDAEHGTRCDVEKGLPRRHDIEVIVRRDVEEVQHLIEHFAMLCRDERPRFDRVRVTHELPDNGGHFDCLGTCAKDRHDFDFAGHSACAPLRVHTPSVLHANTSLRKRLCACRRLYGDF